MSDAPDHGASFNGVSRDINKLLYHTFREKGVSKEVSFLLDHGASFDGVPRGKNLLLYLTFKNKGVSEEVTFLLDHGASFEYVPRGIHLLLLQTFGNKGASEEVTFLLDHGASFDGVLPGIHLLLHHTFGHKGVSEEVTFLLDHGASFDGVPQGMGPLLFDTLRDCGFSANFKYLMARSHESSFIYFIKALDRRMDSLDREAVNASFALVKSKSEMVVLQSGDGNRFKVEQTLLRARSSFFETRLAPTFSWKDRHLDLRDCQSEALSLIVDMVQSSPPEVQGVINRINKSSDDTLAQIHEATKVYQLGIVQQYLDLGEVAW